ncbi:MAG: hypothetical protein Q9M91_08340 [Candidatus Dojkabacteria bacterium]|nr:hypothetical protein [Candidatus Dojkabacteria bacterium]MDQ7021783.1 hypothetical protein [Candidatus Dojkabacteria bacterium]
MYRKIILKLSFILAALVVIFPAISITVSAQSSCDFVTTKVRAQLTGSTPWTENLNADASQNPSIRITAFQCTAAQTAACDVVSNNVVLTLNGAGFNGETFNITGAGSIPTVNLIQNGTLTITATTPNKSGAGCTGTSTVNVTGITNTPTNTCDFVATKFRAQLNSNSNWTENLSVDKVKNPTIRIVAFQCTAAQTAACENVASNADITLNGGGFVNAKFNLAGISLIPTVSLLQAGIVNVTVTTPGQAGSGCEDTDTIIVSDSSIGSNNNNGGGTTLPNTSESDSNIPTYRISFIGLSLVALGTMLKKNSNRTK